MNVKLSYLLLVTLGVQSPALAQDVAFRLKVVDQQGIPTETLKLNEQFTLQAWIKDVRPTPMGVVSAYLDVDYEQSLVSVLSDSLHHGPDFGEIARSEVRTPPTLDEVGSFARGYLNIPPLPEGLGSMESLLFSVDFLPTATGIARFTSHAADVLPLHATTIHGLDSAVPAERIAFGTAQVEIVPEPSALLMMLLSCPFLVRVVHRLRQR